MVKDKVKDILLKTKREGMNNLINYLEEQEFFESPASTRFHGNYEGGLIDHSLNVMKLFSEEIRSLKLTDNIPAESIVICALLHDACKAGMYLKTENGYKFNPEFKGKGHSRFSIERIKEHIELTEQEEDIIRFHMGHYGTKEFSYFSGEYSLKELTEYNNKDKLIRLFHWCDDKASCFLDKKV